MSSPHPTPAQDVADPDVFGLAGTVLDGKYVVERPVAEGGFGVVYRATHATLGTPVAVKVLKVPAGLDDATRAGLLDAFRSEAQIVARLDHPGVVRVIDFGAALVRGATAPWMALQWIDGETLEEDLAGRHAAGAAPRSPAEALDLLRPVFEAVAAAHEAGVAHRDIKPANVMLARTARGVAARVLDFGIAKVMAGEEAHPLVSGCTATRSRIQAFTPHYASPEQLSASRTGPWTDVLALGLVLTEVLTGKPPYDGEESTELYVSALSPERPTPARRGVDVGPLEAVIARAVSLRVGERYASAGEFLAALEAAMVAPSPPVPPPAETAPQPQRAAGFPRLAALVVALLAAAVATAVAVALVVAPLAPPPPVAVAPRRAAPTPTRVEVPLVARPPTPPPSPPAAPVAAVAPAQPPPPTRRISRRLRRAQPPSDPAPRVAAPLVPPGQVARPAPPSTPFIPAE